MSSEASDEIVIKVEDLSKIYGLPFELSWKGIRNVLPKDGEPISRKHLALKNMNLAVRRGELLGVIGRNGAGKSTLLKVLAGVSPPTRGKVKVEGRIFPMIELNAGLSPTLTGRENVVLLGTILGLSPKFIRAHMDEIEEFCDLGEWFDKQVWQYSSGMPGRLGFAIAAYSEADVLLIDEILAVGDLAFRNKCTEKMAELRGSGRTVVLVSHNMSAIAGLCTRTIMIELGEIKYDSLPDVTVQHYKDFVAGLSSAKLKKTQVEGLEVQAAKGFDIPGILLLDEFGRARESLRADRKFEIIMDCEKPALFDEAAIDFIVTTQDGQVCVEERYPLPIEGVPTYRRVHLEFENGLPLRAGEYVLSLRINDDQTGENKVTARRPLVLERKTANAGLVTPSVHLIVSSPTNGRAAIPPLNASVRVSAPHENVG